MTLKRLILALLVVTFAIAPVAHAENAPTCADEHLTGEDCQGPDVRPQSNSCKIKVWVGKASCDVVVPDDYAGSMGFGGWAWADQPTAPEMDIVIRDTATGTVLSQSHYEGHPAGIDPSKVTDSVGRAVDGLNEVANGQGPWLLLDNIMYGIYGRVEDQLVSYTSAGAGSVINLTSGAVLTCEVTGTHSQLGAVLAAEGETPGVRAPLLGESHFAGEYNNAFGCDLQRKNSDSMPIAPTYHGCVATQPAPPPEITRDNLGSSCGFWGEPTGFPSGVVSSTTGSYTVSHEGPSGTVVDIAGSGPGAMSFTFTRNVRYTLTVNGDGTGAVVAGSPE